MPETSPGELLIVSGYVADNAPQEAREKFVVPHNLIRDETGVVIGCGNFRNPREQE